jgi:hypothetical protein
MRGCFMRAVIAGVQLKKKISLVLSVKGLDAKMN